MEVIVTSVHLAEISDLTQPEVRRESVVAAVAGTGRVLVDQGNKGLDQAGHLEVIGLRMSDQQVSGFVGAAAVERADNFESPFADAACIGRNP